jgi:hypothetical protein
VSLDHVSHSQILAFADARVNLHRDDVKDYRDQVWRLRDKLETYLSDHPDFSLKKMMLSGSLAKGTALRTINDIDVAMYVGAGDAPTSIPELVKYLAGKLETAFPNFSADQIQPQTYSVKVNFKGSGLDVDIVPILYNDDPQWRGQLVSQEDGSFLETSIPMHLEFCRTRKSKCPQHFVQNVRLAKYWAKRCKAEIEGFRFKSFMIELIFAKLVDDGVDLSFYPDSLQAFFNYLSMSNLKELIAFNDYYPASGVQVEAWHPIKIVDPVNCVNNVSRLYSNQQGGLIVSAASEAGDAIEWAKHASGKGETIDAWQDVFGPAFSA